MQITTSPSCRIGWQGSTLRYTVKAPGATEVLVPQRDTGGMQFRVTNTRRVRGGVEAQLLVKVMGSQFY
jgi:hypothetical protein